jgi:hypothetical protein
MSSLDGAKLEGRQSGKAVQTVAHEEIGATGSDESRAEPESMPAAGN